MISNHRCDTFELCAVLKAVYDANGLSLDDKRQTLDVKMIINEWKKYIEEHYSVKLEREN